MKTERTIFFRQHLKIIWKNRSFYGMGGGVKFVWWCFNGLLSATKKPVKTKIFKNHQHWRKLPPKETLRFLRLLKCLMVAKPNFQCSEHKNHISENAQFHYCFFQKLFYNRYSKPSALYADFAQQYLYGFDCFDKNKRKLTFGMHA